MRNFIFALFALFVVNYSDAQIINFPDANFKSKLIAASPSNTIAKNLSGNYFKIDANNDGEIEVNEALQVSYLNVNDLGTTNPSGTAITNIEGLHFFSNISYFNCSFNYISNADFSGLVNLNFLSVSYNNPLALVNLDGLVNLQNFQCLGNSNLQSLDLSTCVSLLTFSSSWSNALSYINLKNGSNETNLSFNSNLEYLCIDETQEEDINNNLENYNLSGCVVNSYCTFGPGGIFYTIQGNYKFDSNANGNCEALEVNVPNLKFSISNGITSMVMIGNGLGNYSIPVQAGSHSITPVVLENPMYFNVSPASVTATFPNDTSPFVQNFCVSANGVHPDLEVVLFPTNPARPGFDSHYGLTYRNKGNQVQSGSISLNFEDSKMDLVAVTPATASQTVDNLSWNFTNLQPFESQVIYFTMNINTPTNTPSVNNGDFLNFTATITPMVGDEVPYDNVSAIKQIVVGSYDPNDKTCLEGNSITPSEVGKYVHYVIRFENTGTFPAENIVVKDMIDTTKFDVSTLVPIKGSHDFFTRINGNKVEFIFENINLPFDDANNDGYVAFKIKTKPTLVNGDTFSNSASIYFDYNFPIITNTATTTIQALSTQNFEFGQYFNLYPNPVNTVLNVDTKETVEVSSISIYNQLGQLVVVVPSAQNVKTIDVSSLSAGNYFIKINSNKGTSNAKFVKK